MNLIWFSINKNLPYGSFFFLTLPHGLISFASCPHHQLEINLIKDTQSWSIGLLWIHHKYFDVYKRLLGSDCIVWSGPDLKIMVLTISYILGIRISLSKKKKRKKKRDKLIKLEVFLYVKKAITNFIFFENGE